MRPSIRLGNAIYSQHLPAELSWTYLLISNKAIPCKPGCMSLDVYMNTQVKNMIGKFGSHYNLNEIGKKYIQITEQFYILF